MILFILSLALSVSTHIMRTIYEILKLRNKVDPENKIVFGFIFTNMMLLWISWFNLCIFDPYKIGLYPVIRYAGAGIVICGVILFFISLAMIKRFENYHGPLVTTGIYGYFRHPMYLAFICWLAGAPLYNQSAVAFVMAFLFAANILVWRKMEEVHLIKAYPEYKDYMKKTWF
jgi:protein-S-isoprenylcysteine O-methyltransferase Ste14